MYIMPVPDCDGAPYLPLPEHHGVRPGVAGDGVPVRERVAGSGGRNTRRRGTRRRRHVRKCFHVRRDRAAGVSASLG
jgi:hypothetical protein